MERRFVLTLRLRGGSVLLESIIALTLGSIVMLGCMTVYHNALKLFNRMGSAVERSRILSVVVQQCERDFSAATVVQQLTRGASQPAGRGEKVGAVNGAKPSRKSVKSSPADRDRSIPFAIELHKDASVNRGSEKWPLIERISFLTTHSLEGGGGRWSGPRLVRCVYELSQRNGARGYELWRLETTDLSNTFCKKPDDTGDKVGKKESLIVRHLLCECVDACAVRVIYKKKKEKEKNPAAQAPGNQATLPDELVAAYGWGESEMQKSETAIPLEVSLLITLVVSEDDPGYPLELTIPLVANEAIGSGASRTALQGDKSAEEKGVKKKSRSKNKKSPADSEKTSPGKKKTNHRSAAGESADLGNGSTTPPESSKNERKRRGATDNRGK